MVIHPIYTAAGCKNELFDLFLFGQFQHVLQADHIGLLIAYRVLNTRAYPCFCSQMHNGINLIWYPAAQFLAGSEAKVILYNCEIRIACKILDIEVSDR